MKELIMLLFLSKTILLTPMPMDLNSAWSEIKPQSPLKAITGGASVQIDVTGLAKGEKDFGILQNLFPPGTFEAKLLSNSGKEVLLKDGNYSYSDSDVRVILSGSAPIPTDVAFSKVLIRSQKPLKARKIFWVNGKK